MNFNYADLVKGYYESLHTNLRNFKQGPDFLDMWVHDENHLKSIYGIFESAEGFGEERLSLSIAGETMKSVDRNTLQESLKDFGEVAVTDGRDEVTIHVQFVRDGKSLRRERRKSVLTDDSKATLSPKASAKVRSQTSGKVIEGLFGADTKGLTIHPVYQVAVQKRATQIVNEGTLAAPKPGELQLKVNERDITLAVTLNDRGRVLHAVHSGATGIQRVLFDVLCSEMVGRPIQEAAEHGVIFMEYALRDHEAPPPVAGVVTPLNADPAFRIPLHFSREIYDQFSETSGKKRERNFWKDKASQDWLAKTEEERIQIVRAALLESCRQLGLQETDIEIVSIKHDVRVVLSYTQALGKPDFGNHMIKLERILRRTIEPQLELHLESVEDKNKRIDRTSISRQS